MRVSPSVTSHSHQHSAALNHVVVQFTIFSTLSGYGSFAQMFFFNWTSKKPSTILNAGPETWICCSGAASCAFNQKMQLTEPILHSPFTPLHSTLLHLLPLHSIPQLPLFFPSLRISPGCHQNAGPVWRTTHRVIINKRR